MMKRLFYMIASALVLLSALTLPAYGAELLKSGSQGEDVLRVQMRLAELDYFNIRPTGVFGSRTRDCVVAFQEYNEIMADGSIGQETMDILCAVSAVRKPIGAAVDMPIGIMVNESIKVSGSVLSWDEANGLFAADEPTRITDCWSGQSFDVTRLGGVNHAEVACSTKEDTDVFLAVFGGEPNWSKRPVVVHLPGNDVAASLQGLNHGADSVGLNELEGYCCLYFEGSTSHFNSFVDVEHRSNISIAAGNSE
jgi:peptidoglycan hydrolase-like protein with peptidoglycan-binding domain